jgi:hypothetical protein
VNFVLEGNGEAAASLKVAEKFPIIVSRSLKETRSKLRAQGIGSNRYGLIGSSCAARLRAEGLEASSSFHKDYPWQHWYLGSETDTRSSYRCEVFATEFEIQGLELDWIGLCWGGDLIWDETRGWLPRTLRPGQKSRWSAIKNSDDKIYRKNAYRVLLTRSRQGMTIFIPQGDDNDPTVSAKEFDSSAQFLIRCGATPG